eukprot:TRINITY_DN1019_c2_g1_i1.p1 TRINITY_DN1019_c2_g1~~TRINITY_DN1019_c2_g1_i1.p1  ORF type:complete len:294 (+),score=36.46 TRINITY_DN1019_c2_g1_i1:50-931(+)
MFMPPFGGGRRHHYHGGGRRGGMGLLMLLAQMNRMGFGNIPTVTMSVIIANVWVFLNNRVRFADVCLSLFSILRGGQYYRMLTSAFVHADDWHLSYNMSSFMWKGAQLERAMGMARFISLLLVFIIATPVIHMMICYTLLETHIDTQGQWASECAIGFSGIIFALKVVTTTRPDAMYDVFQGLFSVQGKYVVWAELILIHFIYPGTSFLGHLSGILAGVLYTKGFLSPFVDVGEGIINQIMAGIPQMPQGGRYNDDYGDADVPPAYRGAGDNRDYDARQRASRAAQQRWGGAY